jgi:hypothetical protein
MPRFDRLLLAVAAASAAACGESSPTEDGSGGGSGGSSSATSSTGASGSTSAAGSTGATGGGGGVDSAAHGIDRGWSDDDKPDFMPTNTFTNIAACKQTYPSDTTGACIDPVQAPEATAPSSLMKPRSAALRRGADLDVEAAQHR